MIVYVCLSLNLYNIMVQYQATIIVPHGLTHSFVDFFCDNEIRASFSEKFKRIPDTLKFKFWKIIYNLDFFEPWTYKRYSCILVI